MDPKTIAEKVIYGFLICAEEQSRKSRQSMIC